MTAARGDDDAARGAPAPGALLSASGLACAVAGRVLWRDVQLTLQPGESLAVTGPSGTGKTLLLRSLAGLRPVDAGEIRFEGKPLGAWWMPAYRAQVVYLAQRSALPEGTVGEALAAPFALRVHRGRRFRREIAVRHLAALGMDEAFLGQASEDLSGGETQVAALVRALLVGPRVLLLDEPTAALDPDRTRGVEALLRSWLGAEPGRACVWVSHDAAQVARVSDHVLDLTAP